MIRILLAFSILFLTSSCGVKNNQTLDELDFLKIKKVEKSLEKDVL